MNRVVSLTARRLAVPTALVTAAFLQQHTSWPPKMTRADDDANSSNTDDNDETNDDEEDERTTCSICLVNRQGPCRGSWRKFEACLKNHRSSSQQQDQDIHDKEAKDEEASADATAAAHADECDNYMLSWLTCVQSYRNLYMLYYNYMSLKEVIEPLEKELREEEVYEWKDVHTNIDWTPYVDWVKTKGFTLWDLYWSLKLTAPPITPRPKFEGTDPEVVEVQVKVSLEDQDGLPIRLAYAKDQGGGLLGMEHFGDDKVSDEEKTPGGTANGAVDTKERVLKLAFQPERTSSIEVFAFYKNEADEARMLYSGPIPLVTVAMEAGGIPEGEM